MSETRFESDVDQLFIEKIADYLSSNLHSKKISKEQLTNVVLRSREKDWDFLINTNSLKRFKITVEVIKEITEIVKNWKSDDFISEVKFTSDNFIQWKVNKLKYVEWCVNVFKNSGEDFGKSKAGAGKTIIVEFSSPNIAKPFHVGHLRSTIIGNFMAKLLHFRGYKVITMNYLGDWGKQYGLLANGFYKYGSEEELVKKPIKHLFDVYVKINNDVRTEVEAYVKAHPELNEKQAKQKAKQETPTHAKSNEIFSSMEQGDSKYLPLWKKFRETSIEEYKKIYSRLGISFDVYSGESLQTGFIPNTLDELKKNKLMIESDGAKVVKFADNPSLGTSIIVKSDGSTLYITRDIAAACNRYETYHFDEMYYVVASQQDLHFQQLFNILDKLGKTWSKNCHHINFGMVKGMSTRKGTVVFLEQILEEAKSVMLEKINENEERTKGYTKPLEEIADKVGISSVFAQDMLAKRRIDYDFDWDRMTRKEGKSGVYLQYAFARLCGIERKAGIELDFKSDLLLLKENEALQLAMLISKFPHVLEKAQEDFEPSILLGYLFELTEAVSTSIPVLQVKGLENKELSKARWLLYWMTRVVLKNGMMILGLSPQEEI